MLPLEEPESTSSGIVLPQEYRESIKTHRAIIVAVGPGFPLHGSELGHTPLPFEVGQEIAYACGTGSRLELRDSETTEIERLLVLDFGEILAVLEPAGVEARST